MDEIPNNVEDNYGKVRRHIAVRIGRKCIATAVKINPRVSIAGMNMGMHLLTSDAPDPFRKSTIIMMDGAFSGRPGLAKIYLPILSLMAETMNTGEVRDYLKAAVRQWNNNDMLRRAPEPAAEVRQQALANLGLLALSRGKVVSDRKPK